MRIRRRGLRKLLVAVGCVLGQVTFPAAAIGGGLLLLGGGLHLWSKGCLEQNQILTTAGPYRWTRNPFYLANALVDLGLCCVIGSIWVALVFWPCWWLAYRETMKREEQRLLGLFPDIYPDYADAVPRLFPTGRAWPVSRVQGAFSWANKGLLQGAEYARLLGLALAAAAIWAAEVLREERLAIFESDQALELGLVSLVIASWGLKLGLSETFRRPGTWLLPGRPGSAVRRFATGGCLVIYFAIVGWLGSIETALGVACLTVALVLWPSQAWAWGWTAGAFAIALALVLTAGVMSDRLWVASFPALWCALAMLDALGDGLASRRSDAVRKSWRPIRFLARGLLGRRGGRAGPPATCPPGA